MHEWSSKIVDKAGNLLAKYKPISLCPFPLDGGLRLRVDSRSILLQRDVPGWSFFVGLVLSSEIGGASFTLGWSSKRLYGGCGVSLRFNLLSTQGFTIQRWKVITCISVITALKAKEVYVDLINGGVARCCRFCSYHVLVGHAQFYLLSVRVIANVLLLSSLWMF